MSDEKTSEESEEGIALAIVDDHEEEVTDESGAKVRRRGVYLLPNLFTAGAMFAGFFAIISALKGNFESAGAAIIVAQLLDGMDGRVARLTNTQSAFGVEFDSLSDMVSFGVAPALVIYSWALEPLGKIGWAAAFLFCLCAALRLARFNTQVGSVAKTVFFGLASPAAAAVLATIVWSWHGVIPSKEVAYLIAFVTAVLAVLMVSNIRYSSFKGLNLKGRVHFFVMFLALLGFVVVLLDPPRVLLMMALVYCLSGPAAWVWSLRKTIK